MFCCLKLQLFFDIFHGCVKEKNKRLNAYYLSLNDFVTALHDEEVNMTFS